MARERFNFWLDCDKDSELLIAEVIDGLKAQRSFTKTIRNGIRLIVSLEQGDLSVLFELWPHLRDQFNGGSGSGDDDLRAQLARLESALLNAQFSVKDQTLMQSVSSAKTASVIDDDEMLALVVKKADDSGKSGENFLASAFALVQ